MVVANNRRSTARYRKYSFTQVEIDQFQRLNTATGTFAAMGGFAAPAGGAAFVHGGIHDPSWLAITVVSAVAWVMCTWACWQCSRARDKLIEDARPR